VVLGCRRAADATEGLNHVARRGHNSPTNLDSIISEEDAHRVDAISGGRHEQGGVPIQSLVGVYAWVL